MIIHCGREPINKKEIIAADHRNSIPRHTVEEFNKSRNKSNEQPDNSRKYGSLITNTGLGPGELSEVPKGKDVDASSG